MKELPRFFSDVIYIPLLGYGVIGNTAGFDPVILGSSPSSPMILNGGFATFFTFGF